eukprot:6455530-Prymnesium_polylepis.1
MLLELSSSREELNASFEALREEIAAAKVHETVAAGRIELDVGGHKFVTTVETLQRSSFFASLTSGVMNAPFFIDRDPVLFRSILQFRLTIKKSSC